MKKILLFALILSILASCSTSNQVVSNKLFQKRKYKKGWHVNSTKKVDKVKKSEEVDYAEESVAVKEATQEEAYTEEQQDVSKQVATESMTKKVSVETQKETNSLLEENIELNTQEINNEEVFLITTNDIENQEKITSANTNSDSTGDHSSGFSMLLLVILCIFLPPVAVGLIRGWGSTEFLISLVLFLIGWGLFALSPLASLASLAGIVYAFLILFDVI